MNAIDVAVIRYNGKNDGFFLSLKKGTEGKLARNE